MGIAVDTSDPFAPAALPEDVLFGRLGELIEQERELDRKCVTCPLKDRNWSHPTCIECPERGAADRAELCRIGIAQEEVLDALEASRLGH